MRTFAVFLLPLLAAACTSPEFVDGRRELPLVTLLPHSSSASRGFALDDVTNGLQSKERSGPEYALKGIVPLDDAGKPIVVPQEPTAPPRGTERLLVQRGEVHVEVARPEDALARFTARVGELGGHLAQQNDNVVVVRVPVAKFEALFAELRTYGRVLSETRRAEDVTEEYVDLGIRLDTARRARERLTALLEKADKVEDVLKIEEQLRRLTEEIERMEGRRKFLADQAAVSSLTAAFHGASTSAPRPRRAPALFPWLERLGADRVLEDF